MKLSTPRVIAPRCCRWTFRRLRRAARRDTSGDRSCDPDDINGPRQPAAASTAGDLTLTARSPVRRVPIHRAGRRRQQGRFEHPLIFFFSLVLRSYPYCTDQISPTRCFDHTFVRKNSLVCTLLCKYERPANRT